MNQLSCIYIRGGLSSILQLGPSEHENRTSGLGIETMAVNSQTSLEPQVQGDVVTARMLDHKPDGTDSAGPSGDDTTLNGNVSSAPGSSEDLPERKIFPGLVHEQSWRSSGSN